jgi:hypothetical protein
VLTLKLQEGQPQVTGYSLAIITLLIWLSSTNALSLLKRTKALKLANNTLFTFSSLQNLDLNMQQSNVILYWWQKMLQ